MELLKNEFDFKWYKKELDLKRKCECRHKGEPEKYPCKVESDWWENGRGPYQYDHEFTYEQKVVCDSCGTEKVVWPEINE